MHHVMRRGRVSYTGIYSSVITVNLTCLPKSQDNLPSALWVCFSVILCNSLFLTTAVSFYGKHILVTDFPVLFLHFFQCSSARCYLNVMISFSLQNQHPCPTAVLTLLWQGLILPIGIIFFQLFLAIWVSDIKNKTAFLPSTKVKPSSRESWTLILWRCKKKILCYYSWTEKYTWAATEI